MSLKLMGNVFIFEGHLFHFHMGVLVLMQGFGLKMRSKEA